MLNDITLIGLSVLIQNNIAYILLGFLNLESVLVCVGIVMIIIFGYKTFNKMRPVLSNYTNWKKTTVILLFQDFEISIYETGGQILYGIIREPLVSLYIMFSSFFTKLQISHRTYEQYLWIPRPNCNWVWFLTLNRVCACVFHELLRHNWHKKTTSAWYARYGNC